VQQGGANYQEQDGQLPQGRSTGGLAGDGEAGEQGEVLGKFYQKSGNDDDRW